MPLKRQPLGRVLKLILADMIDPQHAFATTILSLTPTLETAGFALSEERYEEASFGSRYTTFGREDQEVRLVWDGKESWLLLEARPLSHREHPHGWVDLSLHRLDRAQADDRWIRDVSGQMTEVLNGYLKNPLE